MLPGQTLLNHQFGLILIAKSVPRMELPKGERLLALVIPNSEFVLLFFVFLRLIQQVLFRFLQLFPQ